MKRLNAALATLVLGACAAAPQPAPPADDSGLADLEWTFWYCDYVGTTRGVQAAPFAACKLATEELKKRKFGGSFEALLSWWRQNKAAEHRKLDRVEDSTPI